MVPNPNARREITGEDGRRLNGAGRDQSRPYGNSEG